MKRPVTTLWNRKGGDAGDQRNLIAALTTLVHRAGGITIPANELDQLSGKYGLRARYERDGSMTLWTYDVVEDLKDIASGH